MKKLITLFVILASMNIAVASELGEGSTDCTSLVQSNRAADVVVASSSAEVEVEESAQR